MKVKKQIIKFISLLFSLFPWRILDKINPDNLRITAFKNSITMEKYLRSGRKIGGVL